MLGLFIYTIRKYRFTLVTYELHVYAITTNQFISTKWPYLPSDSLDDHTQLSSGALASRPHDNVRNRSEFHRGSFVNIVYFRVSLTEFDRIFSQNGKAHFSLTLVIISIFKYFIFVSQKNNYNEIALSIVIFQTQPIFQQPTRPLCSKFGPLRWKVCC
jgi:hypothetical protein